VSGKADKGNGQTVCLDFDGVCNAYDGWQGEEVLFPPRPGLGPFIHQLLERGYRVAIFSTRPPNRLDDWFVLHRIVPPCAIYTGRVFFPREKPPAVLYVDDQAFRFEGDYERVLAFLQEGRDPPYWDLLNRVAAPWSEVSEADRRQADLELIQTLGARMLKAIQAVRNQKSATTLPRVATPLVTVTPADLTRLLELAVEGLRGEEWDAFDRIFNDHHEPGEPDETTA